jgi:hypothetical protein
MKQRARRHRHRGQPTDPQHVRFRAPPELAIKIIVILYIREVLIRPPSRPRLAYR